MSIVKTTLHDFWGSSAVQGIDAMQGEVVLLLLQKFFQIRDHPNWATTDWAGSATPGAILANTAMSILFAYIDIGQNKAVDCAASAF